MTTVEPAIKQISETLDEMGRAVAALRHEALETPMTGHDRCDVGQCGAQAYVRVLFANGPVLFCGHHYAEKEASIMGLISGYMARGVAFGISDQRVLIGTGPLDVSA